MLYFEGTSCEASEERTLTSAAYCDESTPEDELKEAPPPPTLFFFGWSSCLVRWLIFGEALCGLECGRFFWHALEFFLDMAAEIKRTAVEALFPSLSKEYIIKSVGLGF